MECESTYKINIWYTFGLKPNLYLGYNYSTFEIYIRYL